MAKPKTTKKASKKTAMPSRATALRAALNLAAKHEWSAIVMGDIAAECGCTPAELQKIFKDKNEVLIAYGEQLDRKVAENVYIDDASPERDRLFDVIMERFDILNEDRAAILSIAKSFCTDPRGALSGLPHLGQSMTSMLDIAKIKGAGPRGIVTALGLTGVYLYALKVWRDDEKPDMGKTMAALDKALGHAEGAAQFLGRFI
ncbi:MAG: bacterial regulatory s, tetR family protein [Micavibrio sp.]|nr:bacterial regulatory s, tetR family protein [Micavibrio sp.]